jgi:hypothetical protein
MANFFVALGAGEVLWQQAILLWLKAVTTLKSKIASKYIFFIEGEF